MAATPNVQEIDAAVKAKFPDARFGHHNCRLIGSRTRWSQHAASEPAKRYYGNGSDITHRKYGYSKHPLHQIWLLRVKAFIKKTFPDTVRLLLGPGDAAHSDHVHVDCWPKMKDEPSYRPPCKGGTLVVVNKDGTTDSTFGDTAPPPPPPNMEDEMTWKTALQRQTPEYYVALNAQTGSPAGADPGYWGRSHNAAGDRIAPSPNDAEWDNALNELAAAALEVGVLTAAAPPPDAHDHPHSHPIPTSNTGPNP